MYKIPMEELINKIGSTYKLVMLASKRAVELNAGAGKLVEAIPGTKLSTIALKEISQGKVRLKNSEEKGE